VVFDALSGTILNAVAVAIGTTVGLVAAPRISTKLQEGSDCTTASRRSAACCRCA
jgi:hypothetical protein